jgi:hypothetical protein
LFWDGGKEGKGTACISAFTDLSYATDEQGPKCWLSPFPASFLTDLEVSACYLLE